MQSISGICTELARLTEDQPKLSLILKMAAAEAQQCAPLRSLGSLHPELPLRLVGIWDWDLINDRSYGDPDLARMFGTDPVEIAKGVPVDTFVGSVHPDDVQEVNSAINDAMIHGGVVTSIYRVVDKQQQERTVFAKGVCTLNERCRPERFAGTVIDISASCAMKASSKFVSWSNG